MRACGLPRPGDTIAVCGCSSHELCVCVRAVARLCACALACRHALVGTICLSWPPSRFSRAHRHARRVCGTGAFGAWVARAPPLQAAVECGGCGARAHWACYGVPRADAADAVAAGQMGECITELAAADAAVARCAGDGGGGGVWLCAVCSRGDGDECALCGLLVGRACGGGGTDGGIHNRMGGGGGARASCVIGKLTPDGRAVHVVCALVGGHMRDPARIAAIDLPQASERGGHGSSGGGGGAIEAAGAACAACAGARGAVACAAASCGAALHPVCASAGHGCAAAAHSVMHSPQ